MYLQLEDAAIHLDIRVTENLQQVNKIIYCLVLFGGFRLGNIAVFIPNRTSFYIEIDPSPESGLEDIFFLRHFRSNQLIDTIIWQELQTNDVKIQGVAHHLQAIASGTIYFSLS